MIYNREYEMNEMSQQHIIFFEEIKKFQEEQKKQKQRGLNDYNMVNVVRKENAEVGMHSNVIYSLIDPNGLHYQDDLFLNLFIKVVLNIDSKDFGILKSVEAEESTDMNRRIDFTIKSSNYYIGIEMKIDASDLDEQISHYYDDLAAKANNDNIENVVIYYLTKDGKEASPNSHKGIDYEKISFEKHILDWIEKCQSEVRNITNLNEAFENYKDIVRKITNKFEGKVMSLEEFLENEKFRDILIDIENAQKKYRSNFYKKLNGYLLKNENVEVLEFSNKWHLNIQIHKKYKLHLTHYEKDFNLLINTKILENEEFERINQTCKALGFKSVGENIFCIGKIILSNTHELRESLNKLIDELE